ncbi:MAG: hypothetical protein ACQGVC_04880 [Myxococcota bacterium]
MSTILKALRRLEEEKQSGGERPLREQVAAPEAEPPRRGGSKRLLWLLGVAWLVVAAGLAWTQRERLGFAPEPALDVAAEPAPPQAPVARAPSPPRPAPVQRTAPAPVEPAEAGLPEEAFASRVEVVERPPAEPRTPIVARAADPPEAAPPAPADPGPEPAPVVEKAAAPKPPPVVEKPAPKVAAAAEPKPEPKIAAAAAPKPEPKIAAAPPPAPAPEPVARAPEPAPAPPAPAATAGPIVEKTLWHPTAARRVAFLEVDGERRRVAEGDVVGRYVVSEIQPSGVVFLSDGRPVARKIGEK